MSYTTLCDECFPESDDFEQCTIVPLGTCEVCKRLDARHNGLRVHLFRGDPREWFKEGELMSRGG